MISSEFLASVVLVIMMVQILVIIYVKTGSLLKAWIISLIVGKTLIIVFWAFGITHKIATLYLYNKINKSVITFEITSNHIIFISFLITLILSVFWYDILKIMPRSFRDKLRRAEVIR